MNTSSDISFYTSTNGTSGGQAFLNLSYIDNTINISSAGSAPQNPDFKIFSVNHLDSFFNTFIKLNEWYNANHESNATGAL
ncbi:hypothetical protein FACS189459_7110 [Bacilli bacterium]|nr:hypothetical protein FACS189459_7110 [Bacilli bacterium]